ncbi:MAG TPA: transglycosylase SLT domain-containing protein [Melioribacteraceae bacterium]|nr:transglycosylase SLT domain-containing protein [Melioribacteraceae bacterium]
MKEISLKVSNNEKHLSQITQAKSRFDDKQKAKIANAANEFESLLTSMMLRSMNSTTGGILGDSGYGNDMFDTIFEQQIASQISKSKNLGIAEAIYRKVTGEELSPLLNSIPSRSVERINIDKVDADTKIKPSSEALKRLNKFDIMIDEASNEFGLDKNLIKSVILTESAANHKAVSSAKAKGLMQLIDSTASDMGVKNVFDPRQNIHGGTKYLSRMLRQYSGDLKLALAAYNAGPQNVEKFNGVPPFDETKNYIEKVIGYLNHFSESEI